MKTRLLITALLLAGLIANAQYSQQQLNDLLMAARTAYTAATSAPPEKYDWGTNLVYWYRANETDVGNGFYRDYSGYGTHGTQATESMRGTYSDGGLVLDGVDDSFHAPNSAASQLPTSIVTCVTIFRKRANTGVWQMLGGKVADGGAIECYYAFFVDNYSANSISFSLAFGSGNSIWSTVPIATGITYAVIGTYDSGLGILTDTNRISMWLDGVEFRGGSLTGGMSNRITTVATPMRFGAKSNSLYRAFSGTLYEYAVFNRRLTTGEIAGISANKTLDY